MDYPYYIEYGDIICETTGRPIESPAILVDTESSTCHGAGEYEHLKKKYDAMYEKLDQVHPDMTRALVLLCIGGPKQGITKEMSCYVLNRCVCHSASSFPAEMCRQAMAGTGIEWLKAEMARVPVPTKKETTEN